MTITRDDLLAIAMGKIESAVEEFSQAVNHGSVTIVAPGGGMVSENFAYREFACKCGCGFESIHPDLVAILEEVRAHFGKPVHITSGCRCAVHNARVGGAKLSQHTYARASDITIRDVPPEDVRAAVLQLFPDIGGIKAYPGFTHVDIRTKGKWRG